MKQMEILQQKTAQGSQQTQGETFELVMVDTLRATFPGDSIDPVAKGVEGADVILVVNALGGARCGSIAIELKRTKAWSDGWIQKLKDNQRESKADVSVLVTHTMPKGVERLSQIDGVWVTDPKGAVGLIAVLRASLQEIAQVRKSQAGRADKASMVYDYLGGNEFRGQMEALVESFVSMRDGLESERRAVEKLWSKREKEIIRATVAAAGFYGSMQGLVGSSLPEIKQLSLTP